MKTKYNITLNDRSIIAEDLPIEIVQRYEKIPTSVYSTEKQAVKYIADQIESTLSDFNAMNSPIDIYETQNLFKLGLSTGRTPIGLYAELVRRYKLGRISFENVEVYSIDEFYPIDSTSRFSRNYHLRETLLNHIDILPENIHTPDGTTPFAKISKYCDAYEREVKRFDLLVLGVGDDGQLGFNEPGAYEKSRTRLVQLGYKTRKIQSAMLNSSEAIPQMAITLGIGTIKSANKIILMAWGESKAEVIQQIIEGNPTPQIPASFLQNHINIEVVVDKDAANSLTRIQTPWLVGPCNWDQRSIRKAVVWLCRKVNKPILKLTYNDYVENTLSQLLDFVGRSYDQINISVFNDIQHTITGWPGGKPNADDTTRPVPSYPTQKKVLIFSPHPDDDVISMGGTFIRLVEQEHDVHVAYQVSGNVAVHDDVVVQNISSAIEMGFEGPSKELLDIISKKERSAEENRKILDAKGAIRRAEASAACRSFGLDVNNKTHFLNIPFYETGGIKKGELSQADIDIIINKLREIKPHQIYAAGDLADPHGTHRICIEAILEALDQIQDDEWLQECHLWLYRGAWQEWDLDMVDMAVPLSPDELIKKRHAIYRHLSQKDIVPFPGDDSREFWQRAEDRTQNTARLYNDLGMAEYQAIEVFVKAF